jgi:hypothetical protein
MYQIGDAPTGGEEQKKQGKNNAEGFFHDMGLRRFLSIDMNLNATKRHYITSVGFIKSESTETI